MKYKTLAITQFKPLYIIRFLCNLLYRVWAICVRSVNTCFWIQLIFITGLPRWPLSLNPDNKVHGANMGPIWVLSAPDGPHVGPMNLVIREFYEFSVWLQNGALSCHRSTASSSEIRLHTWKWTQTSVRNIMLYKRNYRRAVLIP